MDRLSGYPQKGVQMGKFKIGQYYDRCCLYGPSARAVVSAVSESEITLTESWIAEDTLENVSADTAYPLFTDEHGNESILLWEYRGDKCYLEAVEEEVDE